MTVIVGLLGGAGAGKSSVAGYLAERYGAARYSLARPLKEIAKRALGFSDEQVYGTQEQKEAVDERYGFSPRWFLQKLGTEGIRAVFGADVWTKLCLETIGRDAPLLAVIEDVRFVNESRAITKMSYGTFVQGVKGLVWRLECPDRETAADASHASESEWMLADFHHVLSPAKRGLDELFGLVDDACLKFTIFPKRMELPL